MIKTKRILSMTVLALAGTAFAQTRTYKAPRTPDGVPDLQGVQ